MKLKQGMASLHDGDETLHSPRAEPVRVLWQGPRRHPQPETSGFQASVLSREFRSYAQPASTITPPAGSRAPRGIAAPNATTPLGGLPKRALDVTIVVLALLLFLPVILLIAMAVAASSPGPLVYKHRRVGFGGREFECLKFRTMVVDGDRVLRDYLARHPSQRAIWQAQRKLDDDPRVTGIGALLRKSSLDELPQLLNVLRGEMSIVGPRPVVEAELAHYGPSLRHYLAARPGITGLWQVSGRSDTSYHERVCLDRLYVTRWTFLRDLQIILSTVPAVLLSRGAR